MKAFLHKIAILAFAGCLIFNSIKAQTYVTGGIFSNTTWTVSGSPYVITDTITVVYGVTLTIQPGVVVKFNAAGLIQGPGTLIANGTPTDSIIFTSNAATPHSGIYNGTSINLASFRYCRFSYANNAIFGGEDFPVAHCSFISDLTGINDWNTFLSIDTCIFMYDTIGISQPNATLQGCVFKQNGVGIMQAQGSVYNCTFTHNGYGIQGGGPQKGIAYCTFDSNKVCGIDCTGDTIKKCIVEYNGTGIITEGEYITLNDISDNGVGIEIVGTEHISCNTICNNSKYSILQTGPYTQSAKDNYFCLPDSTTIQATIYDTYQKPSLGFVYFTPFDTAACASTPSSVNNVSASNVKIKLYPNPNSGKFNLSIKNYGAGAANTVEVYNMLGEKINSIKINAGNNQLDMSDDNSGVYMYRVLTQTGNLVGEGRFIIQK